MRTFASLLTPNTLKMLRIQKAFLPSDSQFRLPSVLTLSEIHLQTPSLQALQSLGTAF